MIFPALHSHSVTSCYRHGSVKYHLAALICGLIAATPALAEPVQDPATDSCEQSVYVPAPAGYDFTARVDRWGQGNTLPDLTGQEHVGKVYINTLPIFDPADDDENNALYLFANRIHPDTRPVVIKDLILFKEGDVIDKRTAEESERILRSQAFLTDAAIRVVSRCHNAVDLEVIAKQSWTLVPEIKAKTSGGKSESGFGFHDSNFLGMGSRIAVAYARDIERNRILLHYDDGNFRGTRHALKAHFEQNSDGFLRDVGYSLPFYALDTTNAWGVNVRSKKALDYQWDLGEEVHDVQSQRKGIDAWIGTSRGLEDGVAHRRIYGIAYEDNVFTATPNTFGSLPPDRRLIYPYIEFQRIEDEYGVGYNINQIHRTEDLQLGRALRARFGLSVVDDPWLVFEGRYFDTLRTRSRKLFQAELNWSGRWNLSNRKVEDTRIDLNLDYHLGQTDDRTLYLGLNVTDTWNLSVEKQVLLGGSNGMRGYPANFAAGRASYRFTAEERLFTDYSLFALFNVGFVAFLDAGQVWQKGAPTTDVGFLSDAGLGIRLVPSKTEKLRVIHIDFGYPIRKVDGVTGGQILVEVKGTL